MSTVLVTGGTGFLGSHCILQLLEAGNVVHTTLRNLDRADDVQAMMRRGGLADDKLSDLLFFEADLLKNDGWAEAAAGCDYVLHVASPFPLNSPKDENDLIVPAREGALRVLRAARGAGARRVVLTSSFAAIGYGHVKQHKPFTESDWTNTQGADVTPYVKSKTLAEKAAWDYVKSAENAGALELVTVNPVGIFGPVLSNDYASSIAIVQKMLSGGMPFCPKLSFGVVDVRDVADLHLRAMEAPRAGGERYLAVADDCMSLQQIARILKAKMGEKASKVQTGTVPNWLLHMMAPFNPELKGILPQLGKVRRSSGAKARSTLLWRPRSGEEAVVATAESLLALQSR